MKDLAQKLLMFLVIVVVFTAPFFAYKKGYADGIAQGKTEYVTIPPFMVDREKGLTVLQPKEVSILAEKKKCDEWGGKMNFLGVPKMSIAEYNRLVEEHKEVVYEAFQIIKCTKQITQTDEDGTVLKGTKTLFSYEF